MNKNQLRYCTRNEIDTFRWDECILKSPSGMLYATSVYLDHTTQNWGGIIYGDYEAVMPLPWRKKYGISYVYTPSFIQQLGLFSSEDCPQLYRPFAELASQLFRYIDLNVNSAFKVISEETIFRTNYILHLDKEYENIFKGYTEECRMNLKKAAARGCCYSDQISIESIINLYREIYGSYHPRNEDVYSSFYRFASGKHEHIEVIPGSVVQNLTGKLLYAGLLLKYKNRICYVMGAPTAEGRKARATYYFIDHIIRTYSGTPFIFDFEGSELENVAAFYRRFGPVREEYINLKLSRLPWPVSLFKK